MMVFPYAGMALTVMLAALLWLPPASAATWELLSPFPRESVEARGLDQFASDVEQASEGGLRMIVIADPTGLTGRQIKQAVAVGHAPAGEFLLADLRDDDAAFEADSVPFLATDYDEAMHLWDASRPVLGPMLEDQGLHPVFVVASPPRGLYAAQAITATADLRGIRLLDNVPLIRQLAVLVEAVPTSAGGSMTEAFAAKQVEAAIASAPAGVAEQAWSAVANYYDLRVTLPKRIVVFNKDAYGSLDPTIQRVVLNAAIAAQNRAWKMSADANNDALEALRAGGMTVVAPDPQWLADMRKIGARMAEDWERRSGPDGRRILSAYRSASPR